MISVEKKNQLFNLVLNQLNYFFDDKIKIKKNEINKCFNQSLERTINCFSNINNSYYYDKIKKKIIFNHLNSDHLATFLYYLSNTCFENKLRINICDKIYYLNKMLNAIDLYYEVKMPEIFILVHPVGTVLGRAEYSNYLIVYQGVNVGSNKNYNPRFSKYVTLRPSVTVLGNSFLKENSEMAAGSMIVDKDLARNSIYFGNPKNFIIKSKKKINNIWI